MEDKQMPPFSWELETPDRMERGFTGQIQHNVLLFHLILFNLVPSCHVTYYFIPSCCFPPVINTCIFDCVHCVGRVQNTTTTDMHYK